MSRYKDSSRQGLREGLGCRFVRVDAFSSALSLEPAFRRGLGLAVGLKYKLRLINMSTCYVIGFTGCVGLCKIPLVFVNFGLIRSSACLLLYVLIMTVHDYVHVYMYICFYIYIYIYIY